MIVGTFVSAYLCQQSYEINSEATRHSLVLKRIASGSSSYLEWNISSSGILEQSHHCFGRADVNTRTFLNIDVGNYPVVYDHGVALAALTHAKACCIEGKTHRVGELTVSISDHNDLTSILCFAPSTHDEGIVH